MTFDTRSPTTIATTPTRIATRTAGTTPGASTGADGDAWTAVGPGDREDGALGTAVADAAGEAEGVGVMASGRGGPSGNHSSSSTNRRFRQSPAASSSDQTKRRPSTVYPSGFARQAALRGSAKCPVTRHQTSVPPTPSRSRHGVPAGSGSFTSSGTKTPIASA